MDMHELIQLPDDEFDEWVLRQRKNCDELLLKSLDEPSQNKTLQQLFEEIRDHPIRPNNTLFMNEHELRDIRTYYKRYGKMPI